MALLTEAEARALVQRVLAKSTAETCQVALGMNDQGNVRFARNAVSTSGAQRDAYLVVTASWGKRSGTAFHMMLVKWSRSPAANE